MVFVLRQLQEKCREQNKGLYVTFVDLTKAFDTVSRKGLWQILGRLGCPPKFLSMVMQLHEEQRGQVRNSNDLSEPFPILNGVKQGCVLAPILFTIFFSMMLQRATEKTSVTKMASILDTALMVTCSTYDAYRPTPRPKSN